LLGLKPHQVEGKKIYRAGPGCDVCLGASYSGRVAIHELMVFDEEIREAIIKGLDAKVIKKIAVEKGMRTLRDSALQRVMNGDTSFEEAVQKTQAESIDFL